MPSAIDPSQPPANNPTTASMRANMLAAKNEIEALQNLTSVAYRSASTDLRTATPGQLITDLGNSIIVANGTPLSGPAGVVTTGLPPIKTDFAVRLVGDPAVRASMTSQFLAAQPTGTSFKGLCFWAKVSGRTAGTMTAQIFLGATTTPYSGKSLALTLGIPSDGKWHLLFIPRAYLQAQNGFILGTDTIMSIGVRDRNDVANLGYPGMLTNNEELQLGPVTINPWSRPKFIIRFDDSLSDSIIPNGTFTADGVTQAWSGLSLLTQFGFGDKGSLFHLTRRINTSNSLKTFLTTAQLASLAAAGWSHCIQTHQDPADGANNGAKLLGPDGFAPRTISSVSIANDTLTSSVAHQVINGYWGYPLLFSGTDLPAPLLANTIYWARQVTDANTFQLHVSENDSIANLNKINLTTTGTPANFTWRYGYSASDSSVQLEDISNAKAFIEAMGYTTTSAIWAPNQGALDKGLYEAARSLGIKMILGVSSSGAEFSHTKTKHLHTETTGAYFSGSSPAVADTLLSIHAAIQTDGSPTAADVEAYVEAVCAAGGIGQNFHHTITSANGPVLAAYLNALRKKVNEGVADVITAGELLEYFSAAMTMTNGVNH